MHPYQQQLDQLLGVRPEERALLRSNRMLPPRLQEQLRASKGRTYLVGAIASAVLGLAFVLGFLWLYFEQEASAGALAGASIGPICWIFTGIFLSAGSALRKALAAGVVEVREGLLERQKRHSGKGSPLCSVQVTPDVWFSVEENVHDALLPQRPHRLYTLPGTNVVVAIEAL